MNDVFEIPAGSPVFLGAPANPISQDAIALLQNLVSEESGLIEAHIPQCYIPMIMKEPRQVLFIICSSHVNAKRSASTLKEYLTGVISPGEMIDIFPLTVTHELVDTVRAAGCQIFHRENSHD